jgi:hypothetical protein
MFLHEGSCVPGSAIVRAEDGTETRIGSGDGYVIQPADGLDPDQAVAEDEGWVWTRETRPRGWCHYPTMRYGRGEARP